MLGLTPSFASHTKTGTYLIGATPVVSLVCCEQTSSLGYALGGFQFPASSELPSLLTVRDATGMNGNISVSICQVLVDTTPPPTCGSPGTVRLRTCTSSTGTVSLANRGFVGGKSIVVFVRITETECEGIATSGQVSIKYA